MQAVPEFMSKWIEATSTGRQLLASGLVIVVALLVRVVALRWLRKSAAMSMPDRLRWTAHARSVAFTVVVLGLLFIWGRELRDFAFSLVALGAALVLATKELLMSVSGSLQRATSQSFSVGDRIEVMGIRGDVIDHNLFTTTLLEIGPGHQRTGRTQVLPNSVFLSNSVANETFTEAYVLHTFRVPVSKGEDWQGAEARLLAIATEVCAEHTEPAHRHMDAVSEKHGLSSFDVTPRVTVTLDTADALTLLVRIPTPARDRGRLEQMILRRFLLEQAAADQRLMESRGADFPGGE